MIIFSTLESFLWLFSAPSPISQQPFKYVNKRKKSKRLPIQMTHFNSGEYGSRVIHKECTRYHEAASVLLLCCGILWSIRACHSNSIFCSLITELPLLHCTKCSKEAQMNKVTCSTRCTSFSSSQMHRGVHKCCRSSCGLKVLVSSKFFP